MHSVSSLHKITQMCCTQVCMHVTWMLICICSLQQGHNMKPWQSSISTPSPCHTLSHIPGPPKSMSHISDPLIFSRTSTKARTKFLCTNCLSIVCGGINLFGGFQWWLDRKSVV